MTNTPLLSLQGLTKAYPGVVANDGVSLEIMPGEVHALLGENGAGKSTLLSALAGNFPIDDGQITLNGKSLGDFELTALAKSRGVLSQHADIAFPMSVESVVALGRLPHRESLWSPLIDAVVEEHITSFDLQSLRDRMFNTLSGGEQQRVHLARVAAQLSPIDGQRWLLLDEPTSALDVAQAHRLLGRVRGFCDQGIGVFWVTHDLNLAARYADKIAVLKHGQLLEAGKPIDVLRPDLLRSAFGIDAEVSETDLGLNIFVRG